MRMVLYFSVAACVSFTVSCGTAGSGDVLGAMSKTALVLPKECDGIATTKWRRQVGKISQEESVDLAAKISATAKAQAEKSKELSASGNFETSSSGELTKTVSSYIEFSSVVSEGFWEQNIAFLNANCILDALGKRKDISKTLREEIIREQTKLAVSRGNYSLALEKKNSSTQ
jgi:hypothetical protein